MWMKNLPYCTFSEYNRKGCATFKHPSSAKNEFSDIPNYKLSSKAFDARHLDRFIVRVNESEGVNFSQLSMSQENVRVIPDDVDLAVAAADEVIVEEHQVITSKPTLKSAMATPRKLNTTQPNTVLNTQ